MSVLEDGFTAAQDQKTDGVHVTGCRQRGYGDQNLNRNPSDSSVIFRPLKDPAVDSVLQAARNCFVPEGHLNFCLARYQY
ncbi:MAG: hypothetical protein WAR76_12420, partial [Xanthobacteraceae bacterium]